MLYTKSSRVRIKNWSNRLVGQAMNHAVEWRYLDFKNIYDYIYIYIYISSNITFISDVLLWTPAYGQAKAGRPAQTYIQQLCEDTGCSPEDLPEAMNDREKWRERVRDIRASGMTWWWWWWWYQVNNDCEYPKKECSMHSYLIQNKPLPSQIYIFV